MACTTCVRWMVWNNSDVNQIYYTYNCTTLELESHVVGGGQFQSVCGCLENGAYSDSEDVYIENGGTGYINFGGILLYPCEETPEPSFTPSPFPTRTPNHTPTPTSIVCGSGYTTGQYYYYDCCGVFQEGNGEETAIIFDYTKPYNGVVKLGVPASTSCVTPTPTPSITATNTLTPTPTNTKTPTPTPTLTPTPTITPSNQSFTKLANNCDVITLFPLGVECYGTNPSSSTSYDGKLYLRITGGTAPYNITWEGGQKTPYLFNLGGGDYTVTVVDYYKDFTATTTCSMIVPSPTPTPTLTPTMTPTPSPVYPTLCFNIIWQEQVPTQIEFTPNGVVNGKPSWTNGSGYNVIWNPTQGVWVMSGYTAYGGTLNSQSPTVPPLSGWYAVGSEIPATVSVQDESCSTAVFLSAQILTSLANCENVCNGSILINPIGGTAPYQYSINNGTTFQSSNIFTNLCGGSYSVVVKDSNGDEYSQITTVANQGLTTTYSIGIQKLSNPIGVNQESMTWKVNIIPPIPQGTQITFDLLINNDQLVQRPGDGIIDYTNVVKKNNATLTTTPVSSSSTTNRPYCSPNTQTQTVDISTYTTITMGYNDVVSGTSVSDMEVTLPRIVQGCATVLKQNITVSTTNQSISGCICCAVVSSEGTAIMQHTLGANQAGGGV